MAYNLKVDFDDSLEGVIKTSKGNVDISFSGKALGPYDYFLGGYCGCLHSTFMGIAKKKKVAYGTVNYEVYGEKRDETPTTLKYLKTTITFTGVNEEDKSKITKSMELAERYCSISVTISKVAEMDFEIIFN